MCLTGEQEEMTGANGPEPGLGSQLAPFEWQPLPGPDAIPAQDVNVVRRSEWDTV